MLADINTRTIEPLTPEGQIINAFDIRDRTHYVYAVADSGLMRRAAAEDKEAAIVGTGRTLLFDLLFPVDQYPNMGTQVFDRNELWAVIAGSPLQVKNQASGEFIVLFSEGLSNLALSPDGESLVTALAVAEISVVMGTALSTAVGCIIRTGCTLGARTSRPSWDFISLAATSELTCATGRCARFSDAPDPARHPRVAG